MNLPTTFLLLLYQANFSFGTKLHVLLESVTVNYVNTKLLYYSSAAIPVNETTNTLNLTICFKFQPDDDTLMDAATWRIAKNGRRFPLMKLTKTLHENYMMTLFDVVHIYTKYCRPPLIWPPKPYVVYRSFGWAPIMGENFPGNIISGKYLVDATVRFKNKTILIQETWIMILTPV